ncbi:FAD-binding monooxygenase [Mycena maculata]|uniref:FAD-binding monooxygenase n=1 Tax=Mycena maculata TaxID=230809 RepID=A0AAD7NVQ1_9AGAR|nr:FAD-binding monooxygenase [Mycena maculata]
MAHPSVLIVRLGCPDFALFFGPSGLILALFLRKSGPVRIIDKERTHRIGSRGAGIMPRTLEMYATLGVLDDILAGAGTMAPTAVYEFGELTPKATSRSLHIKSRPQTFFTYAIIFLQALQDRHEEILRAHLAKLSCTVELGAELRSFENVVAKIADGTESEETATFEWLVGTDGARSVVRSASSAKLTRRLP